MKGKFMMLVVVGGEGVRVCGPLAGLAEGFAGALRDRGFAPGSIRNQLWLLAHLSRWMDERGLALAELSGPGLDQFLCERRAASSWLASRRATTHLEDFLMRSDVVKPDALSPTVVPDQQLVQAFGDFLRRERGLAESTVRENLGWTRKFVNSRLPLGLPSLTAETVSQALLDAADVYGPGVVRRYCQVLRSFLRFVFLTGRVDVDLTGATLTVRGHRETPLPVGIGKDQARALLASCDRTIDAGRRAYAVLVLLCRLGLRAGEVAGLLIEDIDWHRGDVVVRGKAAKQERLPLPQQAGDAIADYLVNARPKSGLPEVFLKVRAPFTGLTRSNIANMVRQCCRRAGLDEFGPHLLRHTLAEEMVRVGVPFPAIGQVLRHNSAATTANYARVDVAQLRELARPWPLAEDGTSVRRAGSLGGAR
jgi:site-specific recombinase XerD